MANDWRRQTPQLWTVLRLKNADYDVYGVVAESHARRLLFQMWVNGDVCYALSLVAHAHIWCLRLWWWAEAKCLSCADGLVFILPKHLFPPLSQMMAGVWSTPSHAEELPLRRAACLPAPEQELNPLTHPLLTVLPAMHTYSDGLVFDTRQRNAPSLPSECGTLSLSPNRVCRIVTHPPSQWWWLVGALFQLVLPKYDMTVEKYKNSIMDVIHILPLIFLRKFSRLKHGKVITSKMKRRNCQNMTETYSIQTKILEMAKKRKEEDDTQKPG